MPEHFVWFPLSCLPGNGAGRWPVLDAIYRLALEQAQAVVQPSLPERDLLAVWN